MDNMAGLLVMYIVIAIAFICYQVVVKDRSVAWLLIYAVLFWTGVAIIIASVPLLQEWGLA